MPVVLPDRSSEEGAVSRLLLAECRGPAYSDYNAVTAKDCMQLMKVVLVNRLNNSPSRFGASGAKNLIDIMKARGQFAGFEHYPNYSGGIKANIQKIIDTANSKTKSAPVNTTYVQNAIAVAKAEPVADPSTTGLYFWRTAGRGGPGGGAVEYQTTAGITFYTLSADP